MGLDSMTVQAEQLHVAPLPVGDLSVEGDPVLPAPLIGAAAGDVVDVERSFVIEAAANAGAPQRVDSRVACGSVTVVPTEPGQLPGAISVSELPLINLRFMAAVDARGASPAVLEGVLRPAFTTDSHLLHAETLRAGSTGKKGTVLA